MTEVPIFPTRDVTVHSCPICSWRLERPMDFNAFTDLLEAAEEACRIHWIAKHSELPGQTSLADFVAD